MGAVLIIYTSGTFFNVIQCLGGIVEMGLYGTNREILAAGVADGKDKMTVFL